MKGIITVRYRKETGLNPYRFNLFGKKIGYTTAYTKWLEKQCTIRVVGCSFLEELIEKHKANKKIALDNCKTMKGNKEYPWYDASFNNELLFVWDLEDLKIRLGL